MLTVLILLALGVVAARLPSLPARAPDALDWLVLWVALPAVILELVPHLELGSAAAVPVVVAWGTLVLTALAILLAGRMFRWSRRTVGTLLLVVPLGNTSFLGFPVVTAVLGADHLPYAVLYDQLGSFLALITWGTLIAARYGAGDRPTVGSTVRGLVAFPPFVALVVAVVLRTTGTPQVATEVIEVAGAMLTPLAMLSIGMRLDLPRAPSTFGPLLVGLLFAMGLAPAATLGVAHLVGGAGPEWATSVVEAAMPPMVTAGIVAAGAGLDDKLAAALVGVGAILTVVTAPFWAGVTL